MRLFTMTIAALVFLGMTGLVLANPSMLPKHPGYPSGGEFANDTGQKNLTYSQSMLEAATSGDTNMIPTLMDQKMWIRTMPGSWSMAEPVNRLWSDRT